LHEFKIDDNPVVDFSGNSLTDGRFNALRNLDSIKELYGGSGIIFDVVYQEKEITYAVERDSDYL
jgi:hypothetical protein